MGSEGVCGGDLDVALGGEDEGGKGGEGGGEEVCRAFGMVEDLLEEDLQGGIVEQVLDSSVTAPGM